MVSSTLNRLTRPILLAFLASAAVGLAAQWPGLFNPYVLNDDVRQQLYWMRRWTDHALYPDDILNDYASLYVSWGIKALYWLGSLIVDPLLFSKILAALVYAGLGGLFYATGRALRDEALGLTAMAVCWFSPAFMENISGGLARSFAAPLLVLFILSLTRRNRGLALGALVAQALFIPYILLPCLLVVMLHFIAWKSRWIETPPLLRRSGDALVCVVALGVAVIWQHRLDAAGYGPLPLAGELATRPEFFQGGRLAILPLPTLAWELFARPWAAFAPFREGLLTGSIFSCVTLPFLTWGASRTNWRDLGPRLLPLGILILASLLIYAVARLAAFRLFIPSRYLEYTTNVVLCLGSAILLDAVLRPWLLNSPRIFRVLLLVTALIVGMVRQFGVELYDYSDGAALYAFAQSTSKTSRFAGPPELMDNLLTFGQRNVYVSFELAHPWSTGYWATIGSRLGRLAEAAYTKDPEKLQAFCREEGIDYFLVDRRQYAPEFIAHGAFFEPYSTQIRELASQAPQSSYAVFSGDIAKVQINDNTFVLDMRHKDGENKL